jgi:hypothetical protein
MYQTAVHRGERLDLPVVENEEQLDDVEDEGHLRDAENEEQLGVVVNKNHLLGNDIESEVDQLSEYDGSSGSESAVEEECRGENEEVENHVQNRELNFLFASGRTRSGRVVKTSSRAMLWM